MLGKGGGGLKKESAAKFGFLTFGKRPLFA